MRAEWSIQATTENISQDSSRSIILRKVPENSLKVIVSVELKL